MNHQAQRQMAHLIGAVLAAATAPGSGDAPAVGETSPLVAVPAEGTVQRRGEDDNDGRTQR